MRTLTEIIKQSETAEDQIEHIRNNYEIIDINYDKFKQIYIIKYNLLNKTIKEATEMFTLGAINLLQLMEEINKLDINYHEITEVVKEAMDYSEEFHIAYNTAMM
jgi:hypothetical protein